MKLAFYLNDFYDHYYDNIPMIIQGKDQEGLDCWFYVSKQPIISENVIVPHIFVNGVEMFIKRNKYKKIHGAISDSTLTPNIEEDKKDHFFPGEPIELEELARVFEEGRIGPSISNFTETFYTINVNVKGEVFYGGTTFVPYNDLVNNNQFIKLGRSEKYNNYDLFIFSEPNLIKREWPRLITQHPEFNKFSNSLERAGIRVNINNKK